MVPSGPLVVEDVEEELEGEGGGGEGARVQERHLGVEEEVAGMEEVEEEVVVWKRW